ncbi:MAG: aminotransferase class III-fold pyridoxal phosphate-dependent enzyme, partial [Phycisphaerales bacterium]
MTTTSTTAPSSAASPAGRPGGGGRPATLADQLLASPAVTSAVDALVDEVRARSEQLTDARPANPALAADYAEFMRRASVVRGRDLLYPYLGSGVGRGALVELLDGSVKWDMICGIGVHFFGHSDAEMVKAAAWASISDTVMQGNLQANFDGYAFAEKFLSLAKRSSRLAHIYMSTSGCMANENALKVCYQKHAPASRVIAFKDCFMGRSVTMSQIGDAAANRIGLPLSTQVDYLPFYDPMAAARMGEARYIDGCVAQLREYIDRYPKQHACFIFELVQGEGGFNVGTRDYFKALMDVCKASGIAVWDDEIQSFGRTESMFAYEALGLGDYVDVFCVGKMTQVCATLYTKEYNPGPGLLSGTFTGGSVPFAVGSRALDRLAEGDFFGPTGRFARTFSAFQGHARALIAKHPEWFPACPAVPDLVGGVGGMMRFTPFGGVKEKVMKACKTMFEEGVIVFYCGHGPYHVRMLPPMPVFDDADWPKVFACIERG